MRPLEYMYIFAEQCNTDTIHVQSNGSIQNSTHRELPAKHSGFDLQLVNYVI